MSNSNTKGRPAQRFGKLLNLKRHNTRKPLTIKTLLTWVGFAMTITAVLSIPMGFFSLGEVKADNRDSLAELEAQLSVTSADERERSSVLYAATVMIYGKAESNEAALYYLQDALLHDKGVSEVAYQDASETLKECAQKRADSAETFAEIDIFFDALKAAKRIPLSQLRAFLAATGPMEDPLKGATQWGADVINTDSCAKAVLTNISG